MFVFIVFAAHICIGLLFSLLLGASLNFLKLTYHCFWFWHFYSLTRILKLLSIHA